MKEENKEHEDSVKSGQQSICGYKHMEYDQIDVVTISLVTPTRFTHFFPATLLMDSCQFPRRGRDIEILL